MFVNNTMKIMLENFWKFYINCWIITFPLSLYYVYLILTEVLDFIINSHRIDKMNKYIFTLDCKKLESDYTNLKNQQSSYEESLLLDMKRHVDFQILIQKKNWQYLPERKNIVRAKQMSDIFKLK